MVRAIILLAACCATALAQREPASLQRARGECGRPGSGSRTNAEPDSLWEPGSKIVGGKPALNQAWPWIGALIQAKPGYWPYQFCGGTLISDQWFVTAGHCVDSLSDEDIVNNVQIYMGTNDLTKTPSNKKFRVSRVIKHPQYDQPEGSTNNDIALLKLAKPVAFDSSIKPACMPQRPVNDTSRAFPTHFDKANGNRRVAFVAGWGHTSEGQQRPYNGDGSDAPPLGAGSDILQQVAIAMYESPVCKSKLRGYTYSDKMLCGGFEQGGKDSCQGDSGGPLVAKNSDGAYELIGVVSWGAGCARASMPGIYANVHALKEWVWENMAKN